jgi:type I restriction enzyme S subunit
MNDELRPYPGYKESNLLWLGAVPEHWDVRRNGRLFAQRNETGFGSLPILEVSLKTGVRVRDMENMKRKQVMNDREKYKRAAKGDIAYNMMRMWQGALGAAPVDGLVSPAYVVARPYSGTETRYFSYLFRTTAYMAEVDGYSRGIVKDRNRLYWQDFKQMPSCYPPPDEQAAIADYLDANAILVRKFIRNRRRLIEVLDEQKQAIINQAVTKGIATDASLKRSGVDWLGDVPTHWEVRRLRSCVEGTLAGLWGDDPVEKNKSDHVICVRVADFDMISLGISEKKLTVRAIPATARRLRLLMHGDLVMEKSGGGDAQPVGRVVAFTLDKPAITSNFITRIRPNSNVVRSRFLLFVLTLLQARRRNVPSIKQTTGIQNLDERDYFSNNMGVPPLYEQDAIIAWIDDRLVALRRAQEHAQQEINLIREYRERIVADVVTGKLDVRHLAPPQVSLELDELANFDAEEAFDDELDGVEDDDLTEGALDADD